jgi:hypothetical protein
MTAFVRVASGIERRPWIGSPRHALRRAITRHPSVYLPLARWKQPNSVLSARTRLVLDGFTRSAGTFGAIAFQLAQNDHVALAHHMHASAPLVVAARHGVPVIVTVREPEPTIVSALIREPRVTPAQWLKTYAAFYESLAPYRDRFVIATFEEMTSDFGEVIQRANDRFGTRFRPFEHTPGNVQVVFDLIDERAEGPPWQPHINRFISGLISFDEYRTATRGSREIPSERNGVPEFRVQRPSHARESAKAGVRERYRAPVLAELRTRADEAYGGLVGSGGVR